MRRSRLPAAACLRVRDRIGHGLRRLPIAAAVAAMALVGALAAAGCGTGSGPARSAGVTSHATSVSSIRDYLGVGATADQLPPSVNAAVYKACLSEPHGASTPVSAYIAGYTDASKQNGALPVGFPSLAAAVTANPQEGLTGIPPVTVNGQQYTCSIVELQLDYNGLTELPPVTATFLAFGFMPVTATINLTQTGTGPVMAVVYRQINDAASVPPYTAVSTTKISAQLTDVKVNGTQLDVGSNCRTSGPVYTPELDSELGLPSTLVLTGGNASGDPLPLYSAVTQGGALAGVATIPPFTGCVTPGGENLDALLTASVSGAGNYLKVVQGVLCVNPALQPNVNCTPQGLPTHEPLWTVTHGGSYSGTGQVQIFQSSPRATTVTCPGSIAGVIPDLIGPVRDADFGSVTWAGTTCTGTSTGNKASTWTLQQPRQQQPAFLDGKVYPSPGPGSTSGNIDDLTFVLTQTKGSEPGCTATLTGNAGAAYVNASSTLDLLPSAQVPVTSSTCKELPVSGGQNGTNNNDAPTNFSGSYVLNPSGITIVSP
jgi:hypothetical protein